MNTDALSSVGLITAAKFHQLSEILRNASERYLKQLQPTRVVREDQRFRLWASNLGLYQRGHASLDYRLRDAGLVKQYTRDILEALNDYLSNIIEIVSEQRLPYEDHVLVEYDEDEPTAENENGSSDSQNSEESDHESDIGDIDNEDSQTAVTSAHEEEVSEEIPSRFEVIVERIDSLYSLATKIRNPATRPVRTTEDLYKHISKGERKLYIQERELIEIHIVRYMHKQHILQIYKPTAEDLAKDKDELDNDALDRDAQEFGEYVCNEADWLLKRTGKANARRRAQLLYWQRHADAIAGVAVESQPQHASVELQEPTANNSIPATRPTVSVGGMSKPSEIHSGLTVATRLDPNLIKLDENKSVVSGQSRISSARGAAGDQITWPLPPNIEHNDKYFNCPYCRVICPARYLQQDSWRIHLIHDFQPYHCTYPDCKESDRIYGSRHDWTSHEGNQHERVWHCSIHPDAEFETAPEYIRHLQLDHTEDTAELQKPELVASCVGPSRILRRSCPFCLANFPTVHNMQTHVAYHLEKFALLAIPYEHDRENEDGGSGSSESNRPDARKQSSGSRNSRGGDFDTEATTFFEAAPEEDQPASSIDSLTVENLITLQRMQRPGPGVDVQMHVTAWGDVLSRFARGKMLPLFRYYLREYLLLEEAKARSTHPRSFFDSNNQKTRRQIRLKSTAVIQWQRFVQKRYLSHDSMPTSLKPQEDLLGSHDQLPPTIDLLQPSLDFRYAPGPRIPKIPEINIDTTWVDEGASTPRPPEYSTERWPDFDPDEQADDLLSPTYLMHNATLTIPDASKNSRRATTSSINYRDYNLDLADPTRPPSYVSTTVQKRPANFQCHLCTKKFTRAYNLRSHLRTHTDERPFVCTVCGKAFARQHDLKRHEGLHSGEKRFVCRGAMPNNQDDHWGCGRRFARIDALGRHLCTEAGTVCVKPLRDLEQTAGGVVPSTSIAGVLPKAVLEQYPDLAGIDWDRPPSGDATGHDNNLDDYLSSDDAEVVSSFQLTVTQAD